jgi:hypothetical protein
LKKTSGGVFKRAAAEQMTMMDMCLGDLPKTLGRLCLSEAFWASLPMKNLRCGTVSIHITIPLVKQTLENDRRQRHKASCVTATYYVVTIRMLQGRGARSLSRAILLPGVSLQRHVPRAVISSCMRLLEPGERSRQIRRLEAYTWSIRSSV